MKQIEQSSGNRFDVEWGQTFRNQNAEFDINQRSDSLDADGCVSYVEAGRLGGITARTLQVLASIMPGIFQRDMVADSWGSGTGSSSVR